MDDLRPRPRTVVFFLLLACCCLAVAAPAALAVVTVYDHFDAGVLDSVWTVTLDRVDSWTYNIALSNLTVTEIEYDSLHGEWSSVYLSQEFEALDDLNVDFSVGWDSEGVRSAMQNVMVVLVDTTGNNIILASYHDAWDQNVGRVTAIIDGSVYDGPNNLPHNGQGTFAIQRTDSAVTIDWNGSEILTGTVTTPIDRLEVRFMVGAWPTATFGELSVDLISCEGTIHVPVRNTTWGRIKTIR